MMEVKAFPLWVFQRKLIKNTGRWGEKVEAPKGVTAGKDQGERGVGVLKTAWLY